MTLQARRTRGKTARGRLAQLDRAVLLFERAALEPAGIVVDLGFSQPWTTAEWRAALREVGFGHPVVGVDIDADRVAWALREAAPDLDFRHGDFDLPLQAGEEVCLIRAMNVLRSYPPELCVAGRARLLAQLRPEGLLVEGSNGKHDGVTVATVWRPAGLASILLLTDFRQGFHPRMFLARLAPDQRQRTLPLPPFDGLLGAWTTAWEQEPCEDPRERFVRSAHRLAGALAGVDLQGVGDGMLRYRPCPI